MKSVIHYTYKILNLYFNMELSISMIPFIVWQQMCRVNEEFNNYPEYTYTKDGSNIIIIMGKILVWERKGRVLTIPFN